MKRQSDGEDRGEPDSHEGDAVHEASNPESTQTEEGQRPSASPSPSETPASRPRGHVTVFEAWCKGCGICIEFCPTDVFERGERGAPLVEHGERCSACGWCVTHCPDMAISVRRLAPEELAELEELHELAEQGALPSGEDQ